MGYYYNIIKDLSGKGEPRVEIVHYPDSHDDDYFFILVPFIQIGAKILKIAVKILNSRIFKGFIGFIIKMILLALIYAIRTGFYYAVVTVGYMFGCWKKIVKEYFNDVKMLYRWISFKYNFGT